MIVNNEFIWSVLSSNKEIMTGFLEAAQESSDKIFSNIDPSVLSEDTIKQAGKQVNKGDSGETHGKFNTKKAADAQRRAMYANGYHK